MIRCIIGEHRSGVEGLASACEGIPDIYNIGDIFNPAPQSRIHEFFSAKTNNMARFRDGAQVFHVYKEFFESVVEDWKRNNYTENGLLFTIKYETYLTSPGLPHYLETAGVKFLHIVRADLRALISSILDFRQWNPSNEDRDNWVLNDVIKQVLCRQTYFATLQSIEKWPTLLCENVFASVLIEDNDVLCVLKDFFGLKSLTPLLASTRPTEMNDKRKGILTAVSNCRIFVEREFERVRAWKSKGA